MTDPVLRATGFAPAPQPFADVLVVQVRPGGARAGIDAGLRDLADRLRLGISVLPGATLVLSADPVRPGCSLLSGLATPAGAPVLGPLVAPSADLARCAEDTTTGQFTLFAFDADRVVAKHDYFGMGSLFTYAWDDGCLVTNRLHLAAAFLRCAGVRTALNTPYVLSTALDHMMFALQSFTHDTPVAGLRRVPLEYSVRMCAGEVETVPNPAFAWRSAAGEQYDEVLGLAKAELLDNTAAIARAFPGRELVYDVSGGRDSRLVLAALLATDERPPVTVNTIDPPGSDDLTISAMICAELGLDYHRDDQADTRPLSAATGLSVWRSCMMGEYNALGFGMATKEGASRVVRVTGSAGEVHRDFWNKVLEPVVTGQGISTVEELVSYLAAHKSPYLHRLPPDDRARLEEYLAEQFAAFSGESVDEALKRHYVLFRNRYHFGLRLLSTYHDAFFAMPLLSRELFRASLLQSPTDRSEGRIFAELTDALAPRLARLPYDGDELGELSEDARRKLAEWKEVKAFEQRRRRSALLGHGAATGPESDRLLQVEVARALARLVDTHPDLAPLAEVLHSGFTHKAARWPRDARILASRILALDDFVHPLAEHKRDVTGDEDSRERYLTPLRGVGVRRDGDQLAVTAEVFGDSWPEAYEYAFYVFAGAERVATRWYTRQRSAVFPHQGATRVTAFARRAGGSRVFTVEHTLPG